MRSICFYFQVHQPYRLKRYRFFDIGEHHHYFDDAENRRIAERVAKKSYLPTNHLMLQLIKKYGSKFRISYSISGMALDQFQQYTPEVLDSFRALADTGQVEFLSETYGHSLASLINNKEFEHQVALHRNKIKTLFNQQPVTFRNTELIYSDEIGQKVHAMGFKTMLTEGAKHILGWKSPNFVYCNPITPKLKLLLKNYQLSDDIAFRFSQHTWKEFPLTAEKFTGWLKALPANEQVVNLFMDYETFGEHQWPETGIFNFMEHVPPFIFKHTDFHFHTPNDVTTLYPPVSAIHVPHPISWADEERDLTAWLGNALQNEAYHKLYALSEKIHQLNNPELNENWYRLQNSDHFYYMCTKWFSDGDVHKYFNPYNSPYSAFINYMNVLSDFELVVQELAEQQTTNHYHQLMMKIEEAPINHLKELTLLLSPEQLAELFSKSSKQTLNKIDRLLSVEQHVIFTTALETLSITEIPPHYLLIEEALNILNPVNTMV